MSKKEAGRELDAHVAEKVMGWTDLKVNELTGTLLGTEPWMKCVGKHHKVPEYSTDIAAAWLVVEKMRERGYYINIISQIEDYLVTVSEYLTQLASYVHRLDVRSPSAAEAICRAALAAKEAQNE